MHADQWPAAIFEFYPQEIVLRSDFVIALWSRGLDNSSARQRVFGLGVMRAGKSVGGLVREGLGVFFGAQCKDSASKHLTPLVSFAGTNKMVAWKMLYSIYALRGQLPQYHTR